jgi:DNA polymerase-1
MNETIALLDGDIFAYEAAAAAEEPINWGDGTWTLHALEAPAIAKMESKIQRCADKVEADRIIIALSDEWNFRKDILDTYKSNREGIRRPMLLKLLKEHIELEYETVIRPGLEGDDVLGILSTWKGLEGDKVIITKDKDLLTIPGKHYVMHTDEHLVVTEEEADTFHLVQTLMGDAVDGFSGCPGVGEQTAWEIINDPFGWEQYEHEFKSGKRKGLTELRWKKCAVGSRWEAVVSHFVKAGLCEEEALRQARVAKILRAEDYNFKQKKVKLWKPKES